MRNCSEGGLLPIFRAYGNYWTTLVCREIPLRMVHLFLDTVPWLTCKRSRYLVRKASSANIVRILACDSSG